MSSTVTDDLIVRFRRLFRSRENMHGVFTPLPDGGKEAFTLGRPVPEEMWKSHLMGGLPMLGMSPIMQDNNCYWGAIDFDDPVDTVEFEAKMRAHRLPVVVCRSKSGAAHLFVFFSEPVAATKVVKRLKAWRKVLGIEKCKDNRGKLHDTEVFPKQERLQPSAEANWVNLPYWKADDTDRYCVAHGKKLSLAEFLNYAEAMRISEAGLDGAGSAPGKTHGEGPFADGPPCLETLHTEGWGEGSRNNALFNIAIFHRMAYPDKWQDVSRDFNRDHFQPPLSDDEVDLVLKSVDGKQYSYRCGDSPIESVCQKATCIKRLHGVRAVNDARASGDLPEMTGLVKLQTDPPLWMLNVNGTVVELQTDDLLLLVRFRKACLERLSIIVPMVRQDVWDKTIRALLEAVVNIEAPSDAGTGGEFRQLLSEFIELRRKSRNWDDILLSKPFESDGQVYFRASDLMAFLKRRGFRTFQTHQVYAELRKMHGGKDQKSIRGAKTQLWVMPVPESSEARTPIPAPINTKPKF